MKNFLKTLLIGLFLVQSSQVNAINFPFNPLALCAAAKTAFGAGIGRCQSALAAGAANVAGKLLEKPAVQKMVQNFAADQIKAAIPAGLEAIETLAKTYATPALLSLILANQLGLPGKIWALVKAIVKMVIGLIRTIARGLCSGIGQFAKSMARALRISIVVWPIWLKGLTLVALSFIKPLLEALNIGSSYALSIYGFLTYLSYFFRSIKISSNFGIRSMNVYFLTLFAINSITIMLTGLTLSAGRI